MFYGVIGAIVANVAVLLYIGVPSAGLSTGRYAFLGGFVGAIGLLAFIVAIDQQNIALVPLTALYPVVTVALGVVVLGETVTLANAVGIGLAAVAMVLLAL